MRRALLMGVVPVGALLLMALASCSAPASPVGVDTPALMPVSTTRPTPPDALNTPSPLAELVSQRADLLTVGVDQFEVWVCSVPTTTTASIYEPAGLRLDLDPGRVATALNGVVTDYFVELSSGSYRPQFEAGGILSLTDSEGPNECFASATARAKNAPGVIAIATAEHRAGESGGFGTPGAPCQETSSWPCSAASTGRGVYLGASDFHPDWGAVPAVDLLEHEIGHVLGWPHSGQRQSSYASDIDMMSNSSAPRAADAGARNAQGTLAINRVTAGWIPVEDAEIVVDTGQTVTLSASQSNSGTRVAIIPLDSNRLLTVEFLDNVGLQGHLPEPGITVTLIDTTEHTCGVDSSGLCRVQETLSGSPPFSDLISASGETWSGNGWSIRVTAKNSSTQSLLITRTTP